MQKTIFRQYDKRWASLSFPSGDTVEGSGCGLCSVTHILIETKKYRNVTPADIRPYMIRWAVRNEGLIHAGIPDSLEHYGMENVREFGRSASMKDIFAECNKGNRYGVILFVKVDSRGRLIASIGPDGTCWTGGGHFIAFTDYKVEDGKHWFYMKDSGPRKHDKWFSYEDSMKGCVWKVWTCTLPKEAKKKAYKPTEPYAGKLPAKTVRKGDKGADVKRLQAFLNWYLNTKFKKGIFGEKTEAAVKRFQKKCKIEADGIFGPLSKKKAQAIIKKYAPEPSPYYDEVTYIGQACCNEHGGMHGGKPGDQTGREVCISKWSKDYGWIKVFRHKDPEVRLKLAQFMIDTCENQHIGYNVDRPNRYAAWDNAEKTGHNIMAIKSDGDTTCSQAVSMCLRAVGISRKYARRHYDIYTMTKYLPKCPDFDIFTTAAYTQSTSRLQPGDILLSECHTAIVVKSPHVPEVAKK